MFLKCPDNTSIADFFLCAYLCGQSGVTRDPYMAWCSISQSGVIILSAMHYVGFSDRSEKSNSASIDYLL